MRTELKNFSKSRIKGNIGILFVCTLIAALCGLAANIPFLGIAVVIVVLPTISFGFIKLYLDLSYGENPKIETVFSLFNGRFFSKTLAVYWLRTLFLFLWTLLFVIPGIVKYYSYAMAPYIMIENPDMSASDVISESRRLMDGHKWELFVLDLSFIGWEFLTAITFGLVGIYLIPYYNETYAAYYRYVKSCKGESSPVPDFNIDAI